MEIQVLEKNRVRMARITCEHVLINAVDDALDLMATIRCQTGCSRIILDSTALTVQFFDLKTRLAGEVLQKFSTYQMKLAIIGDFLHVSSKSLRDFIYESNTGRDIFFVASEAQAVSRLAGSET